MKQEEPTRNYMQEIFYTCKEGLLNQMQKPVKRSGAYPLIDDFGNRCALGFLLPDDFIGKFKCGLIDIGEHMDIPVKELCKKDYYHLAVSLQKLHDFSCVYLWSKGLDQIQEDYNIPDLETIT